jgi:hypothetical protein
MTTLTGFLRDADALRAANAYTSLRAALVAPDDMHEEVIRALRTRVLEAAEKYPDRDAPAIRAANEVLRAYANYLSQVMWEGEVPPCSA